MRTLCVDTSVLASIALVEDGMTVGGAVDPDPRHQAEGLGLLLEECLVDAGLGSSAKQAGIDRIVVGTGPGPFTALRAGIAFASALGQGMGTPVLGVPSLEALALQSLGDPELLWMNRVLVLTDARRKEVYGAVFARMGEEEWQTGQEGADDRSLGSLRLLAGPWVGRVEEALELGSVEDGSRQVIFAGNPPAHLRAALDAVGTRIVDLDPSFLAVAADAHLGGDEEVCLDLEPLYLRRPDIHGMPR